jgi:hypothetical protein
VAIDAPPPAALNARVKSSDFRRIALSHPEAVEGAHMSHPDFRVRGKIFATLYPDDTTGVVMLDPTQQERFVAQAPDAFVPASGAWGRRGCTMVRLAVVRSSAAREAIALAWRNKAPLRGAEEAERLTGPDAPAGRHPRPAPKSLGATRRRSVGP